MSQSNLSPEEYLRLQEIIGQRKRAYQLTFAEGNEAVRQVLEDLARFCRANATTFHPDPRVHAALEGRREVWLRIQSYLQQAPEKILVSDGGTE